jgi:hypothetical protein
LTGAGRCFYRALVNRRRFILTSLAGTVATGAAVEAQSSIWDRLFGEGAAGGVFARFKLVEPADASYFVRLGGNIHVAPWSLPAQVWPAGADRDAARRIAPGQFTEWFDIRQWAGAKLHGRMYRSGGIAELPNLTVELATGHAARAHRVVIELATNPDETAVVRRFEESFEGHRTSVLVSPHLAHDAAELETLWQMAERHLRWAREATGGRRRAPVQLLLQTTLMGPDTPQDLEAVWLLGFNVVHRRSWATRKTFPEMRMPGHSHEVELGPGATREAIDASIQRLATKHRHLTPGAPFGFADEICARPPIGTNVTARTAFRAWLATQQLDPGELGVKALDEVVPIETPPELRERARTNAAAARRVFYHTSRFRQLAGGERLRWNSEAFHRHFPPGFVTTSLVADHPYFSGTGLGMGMSHQNSAWGGWPLALDWFDLARTRAVDMIGIEDWMGLRYMYGPAYTWEGPQLMGFQAAIFRSGSRGALPIMAWITPSDETAFALKASSALAQGAKHCFFWTYGPTCESTENYWSDLRGAYDGVARYSRQLAAAEAIIAPGRIRRTRVALLYSISADLWQPFGYVHMLERRATYLALIHQQYLVDLLTEEDVIAGRLEEYDVLHVTDANVHSRAAGAIASWVGAGGWLYGACAAGSRNQYDEAAPELASVFGIEPTIRSRQEPGAYHIRGALNGLPYLDEVTLRASNELGPATTFGVLGVRVEFSPRTARAVGFFRGGEPAAVVNEVGHGRAVYLGACPGLSYLKDARFAPTELGERYPAPQRRLINALATARGAARLVELSEPVVEAGVFDAPDGTAVVLANFTYEPIPALTVRVPSASAVQRVRSVERGEVPFVVEPPSPAWRSQGYPHVVVFTIALGVNDIVLLD